MQSQLTHLLTSTTYSHTLHHFDDDDDNNSDDEYDDDSNNSLQLNVYKYVCFQLNNIVC